MLDGVFEFISIHVKNKRVNFLLIRIPGFSIRRKTHQKYNIGFLFQPHGAFVSTSIGSEYALHRVRCICQSLPVEIFHTQGIIQIQENCKPLIYISIIL